MPRSGVGLGVGLEEGLGVGLEPEELPTERPLEPDDFGEINFALQALRLIAIANAKTLLSQRINSPLL